MEHNTKCMQLRQDPVSDDPFLFSADMVDCNQFSAGHDGVLAVSVDYRYCFSHTADYKIRIGDRLQAIANRDKNRR
jgi:hypothetical protein